jgi:DNA-binding protein HU-beta
VFPEDKRRSQVTKSEFVDAINDRMEGLSRKQAGDAVDAMLETITETLKRGSEITFSGFGKFHVAERGAREGVNPRTGDRMQIPASKVPRFTAGSGLKNAVKG